MYVKVCKDMIACWLLWIRSLMWVQKPGLLSFQTTGYTGENSYQPLSAGFYLSFSALGIKPRGIYVTATGTTTDLYPQLDPVVLIL